MTNETSSGWLTKTNEDNFSGAVDTGLKNTKVSVPLVSLLPAITTIEVAYTSYLKAKAKASQGGSDLVALRNTDREATVSLLRPLLNNINAIANGDLDILLSSAFPLRSNNRTPIGPLGTPEAPVVTQGPTTGTLKASTKRVYGASLYSARLALASAPTVILQTKQGTGIRFLFTDLTPGELYNVEMNAIGAAGPSDWSDDGTMRVV